MPSVVNVNSNAQNVISVSQNPDTAVVTATATGPQGIAGPAGPVSSITINGSSSVTVSNTTGATLNVSNISGAFTVSLPASGVTAGTYGSSTTIPIVTVNSTGIVTGLSTETIASVAVSSLTGTANQVLVNGTSGIAEVGALTLTLPQNINSGASPTFSGANFTSIPNGALTNSSVTVTAGTDLSGGGAVSLGSSVTLNNTATLATVTGRGASTSTALSLTNATASTSTTTGALVVTGGAGIGGAVYGGSVYDNGSRVLTSLSAGTGISITGSAPTLTVSNTGVTSVAVTGSNGLTVGGSPITTSGTITLTLGSELQALNGLSSTGLVTRTAAATYAERTITGTNAQIAVTNGSGVSGNPTIAIDPSYVGQTSITTLGTIGTGTWAGSTITETHGGTNQSSYTLGDILYSSASNTLSKLAGNTTSTRKFLRQTGTGTVSAAPTWDTLTSGDIPALSYVTSVGLSDGSTTPIFTVSGSPVSSSGTLTFTLATQTANKV